MTHDFLPHKHSLEHLFHNHRQCGKTHIYSTLSPTSSSRSFLLHQHSSQHQWRQHHTMHPNIDILQGRITNHQTTTTIRLRHKLCRIIIYLGNISTLEKIMYFVTMIRKGKSYVFYNCWNMKIVIPCKNHFSLNAHFFPQNQMKSYSMILNSYNSKQLVHYKNEMVVVFAIEIISEHSKFC